MARILNAFYNELPEQNLTFNPATVVGGTTVNYNASQGKGDTFGKTNIVAQKAIVSGDIRCLTEEQIQATMDKMNEIVSNTFQRQEPPLPSNCHTLL